MTWLNDLPDEVLATLRDRFEVALEAALTTPLPRLCTPPEEWPRVPVYAYTPQPQPEPEPHWLYGMPEGTPILNNAGETIGRLGRSVSSPDPDFDFTVRVSAVPLLWEGDQA